MDDSKESFANVWLGAETGLLKSVNLVKKIATNHFFKVNYGKEQEICSMCWENENKDALLTGHKNGVIRQFDIKSKSFCNSFDIPNYELGQDHLISMHKSHQTLITCTRNGHINIWNPKTDDVSTNISAGENTQCMAYNNKSQLIAAGGKENCLKLWDVNASEKPIFRAKNVKPNWLQLRIPIHVTNVKFIPNSTKVLTTTGEHSIRIYDPQSETRRPVLETEFGEYPITAVDLCERKPNQVIVGNSRGEAASFDCRKLKHPIRCYKGFAGSIRGIICHETLPYFFSCGLDRHLYVHNEDHTKLLQKVYLKSRLNCLLATDYNIESQSSTTAVNLKRKIKETETEEKDDDNDMWDEMKRITDDDEDSSEDCLKDKTVLNSQKHKNLKTSRKQDGKKIRKKH